RRYEGCGGSLLRPDRPGGEKEEPGRLRGRLETPPPTPSPKRRGGAEEEQPDFAHPPRNESGLSFSPSPLRGGGWGGGDADSTESGGREPTAGDSLRAHVPRWVVFRDAFKPSGPDRPVHADP